jgi:hypothetical protein
MAAFLETVASLFFLFKGTASKVLSSIQAKKENILEL